ALLSMLWITSAPLTAGAQAQHHAALPQITAAEAIERLKAGNQRFVSGKITHPHSGAKPRAELTTGQHPFAVIRGCSTSRVPAELVFDQGFGDLFVVRVAGNVAGEDETGSVEYAVNHLQAPLVLVLGHEQCGAVTAALGSEAERKQEADDIQKLLD